MQKIVLVGQEHIEIWKNRIIGLLSGHLSNGLDEKDIVTLYQLKDDAVVVKAMQQLLTEGKVETAKVV